MQKLPLHDRLFRALLTLFPREFRGDFGEQMADDFRDQRSDIGRRRGRAAVVALWIRTAADVLRRAPAEHAEVLRRDAGYAMRLLRRQPGFAAAVILTLAVGVGSTTAVFTLADPMLFRPLPYPESERIVEFAARANGAGTFMHTPDFLRAEASHGAFEAVAQFGAGPFARLDGVPAQAFGYKVTSRFFDVLRVRPFLGREFLPDEYRVNGAPDAAVLTHRFWQRAFGGRADILSQSLELTGRTARRLRIVGVMPPEFVVPDDANEPPDFLVPDAPDPLAQGNVNRLAWPIARLSPGVTMESAVAELQTIFRATEREFPQFTQGREARLRTLREGLFGPVRRPLLMLLGATGCVLLLACVNLAHLFMARLRARQREFGVRLAIGASRGRLMRLLIVEAGVIAIAGGAAALVAAQWTFEMLMTRTPAFAHIYRLLPAHLDLRVAAFAAALVAVALIIFGALPALGVARIDIRRSLVDGGTSTGARRFLRDNDALIFAQSAVALTLLVAGALLIRSFYRLAYQPLGFEPSAVRIVSVEPSRSGRTLDERAAIPDQEQLYDHLRQRLPVPVAIAGGLPALTVPAQVGLPDAAANAPRPIAYPASGTLFDVLGVRLVSGRAYDDAEAFANAPVAVVDRLAAARLWPGQDPLGKRLVDSQNLTRRVVGVVETLRTSLVAGSDADGTAFMPFSQGRSTTLAIRDPAGVVSLAQVTAAVQEINAGARVEMRPFKPFERTLGQPRFLALLLGTLAAITVALTIVGVFGVVNHETGRRLREVGIRISLGANAARIQREVLGRALAPAVIGIAAGIGLSLWWTPVLQSLLFDLKANDVGTFAISASLVAAIVLVASAVPARRASRVDPIVVLRME